MRAPAVTPASLWIAASCLSREACAVCPYSCQPTFLPAWLPEVLASRSESVLFGTLRAGVVAGLLQVPALGVVLAVLLVIVHVSNSLFPLQSILLLLLLGCTICISPANTTPGGMCATYNPMKSPIFRRPPETSIFPHFSTPETGD